MHAKKSPRTVRCVLPRCAARCAGRQSIVIEKLVVFKGFGAHPNPSHGGAQRYLSCVGAAPRRNGRAHVRQHQPDSGRVREDKGAKECPLRGLKEQALNATAKKRKRRARNANQTRHKRSHGDEGLGDSFVDESEEDEEDEDDKDEEGEKEKEEDEEEDGSGGDVEARNR